MKNNTNFMDTLLDTQKKAVDTWVENTKKITGENVMTEAFEKGSEVYNDWIKKQKESLTSIQEKTQKATKDTKEKMANVQDYFKNWFSDQMQNAKSVWEMNQNFLKSTMPNATNKKGANADFFNPESYMNFWNEGMKQYTNWYNQMNTKKWLDVLQQYNPMKLMDQKNGLYAEMPNMMQSYFDMLNKSYTELQKNFQNATAADSYNNMLNNALSFGKFVEMWMPFWKSIQDKSFNADLFKNSFDVKALKDLADQTFKMMPEPVHQYYQKMVEMSNTYMKDFSEMGKQNMGQMKDFYRQLNPMGHFNFFGNVMDQYNKLTDWYESSVSPIARMTTPNEYTKSATEWTKIFDQMAIYSIKNAELQYMVYEQGMKVMEKLADNVMDKVQNNEEIDSITKLYQEWLNLGDSVYVELFESDEYSKLMADVSSLQLKLKKEIDLQMEKAINKFPIATKTELDELYKIIYDLKKEVRQLEKMLELNTEKDTVDQKEEVAKTTTVKSTKRTATKK